MGVTFSRRKVDFWKKKIFIYLLKGNFGKHQSTLDQENAHMILAEAVTYAACNRVVPSTTTKAKDKAKEVANGDNSTDGNGHGDKTKGESTTASRLARPKFTIPSNSPVKERSAEATVLEFLWTNCKDPHALKAVEVLKLVPGRVEQEPQDGDDASNNHVHLSHNGSDENAEKLRGTKNWAPVRPMLVLKIHEKPK